MNGLAGTGSLVGFIARRERVRLAVWILILTVLPIGTARAFLGLYATDQAREQLARTVASNPAMVGLLGPVYGSTIGALTAWRVGTLGALLVGLMAVLTVIRHTREEEETGRRELIGSTVVGRQAPLTAALTVTVGAGLILGLLVAGGLMGTGLPVGGAVAFGAGFAAAALVFAGLAGLAAQLTEGAGAARGVAITGLGGAFLLRVAGDGGEASGLSWLAWLSPLGWFTRLRAFAGERWWVLLLSAGLAGLLVLAGYGLAARRDVGAGVLEPRIGPGSASRGLGSPTGLAWRLHRGSLLGWGIGLAVVGAVFGSVADGIGELIADNPQMAVIFERLGGERGLTDAFFSAALGIVAVVAAAFAVRAALRMRVEEEAGRAEPVLVTATPRLRWAGSHLAFAILGPVVILAAAGVTAGATFGAITGDVGGRTLSVLGAALIQIPAVWVLGGVATALFGLFPRFTALSWAALVACLLLGQLGEILQLPRWALNLSPFTHIPRLPAPDLELTPLIWLVGIAAAMFAAGLAAFRRRDLD
ncbi:MAG TPA: ABC transporter permease [Acidimicrobiia bacterium]|nr:ABC transporter permease [Acidimicrobiia bacterium]